MLQLTACGNKSRTQYWEWTKSSSICPNVTSATGLTRVNLWAIGSSAADCQQSDILSHNVGSRQTTSSALKFYTEVNNLISAGGDKTKYVSSDQNQLGFFHFVPWRHKSVRMKSPFNLKSLLWRSISYPYSNHKLAYKLSTIIEIATCSTISGL